MDINALQKFYHHTKVDKPCYIVNITATHSIAQSPNPLSQALPLLATQIATVLLIAHAVYFLLRPFNIPRIVAYILGGVLIGPTALSRTSEFFARAFPLKSVLMTETVAYWALTYHVFLIGLEMDVTSILRTSKKTIKVALAGTIVPFLIGVALFFIMNHENEKARTTGCLFYGGVLAMTGFVVVSSILSDIRLLHSEIGRMSISASVFNEMISWVLLVVLVAARISFLNVIFTFISTVGFTVFCFLIVRPFLAHIIKRTSKGDNYSENYLCFVLVAVSISASCSEILGTNSIYGAFIFGLIMPDRVLARALLEKFEDIISVYLLPLFFTVCGLRINLWSVSNWGIAVIVIILACTAKILGTFLSVFFYKIQLRECFALGVLMNSKGILAMVLLNLANDGSFINEQDYAVLVLSIIIMSGAIAPIIGRMYRPAKRLSHYKRRTIQKVQQNSEFRILTCFYDVSTVLGMIHLLDCSNATKESPLSVFALHLVELKGRASGMVVVHSSNKKSSNKDPDAEIIATALETYANLNDNVSVQLLTAFSPFTTMHEDVCSLAEDKHVGFLIMPFHKTPTQEGNLEEGKKVYRGVNLNVLPNAPCTVGIFVDRGFGAIHEESNLHMRQIAMLFVGGPDDREALAYAWRMACAHGIALTVVRFIAGEDADLIEPFELPGGGPDTQRLLSTSLSFVDKQRRFDDEYVDEFRLKTEEAEFISYQETVVNNDEETVETLKKMHHTFDLYIVGKGEGIATPVTAGLIDWCEFPELGPMGDLLVTSSFAQGSVLVVQKYSETADDVSSSDDETTVSRTPGPRGSRGSQQFGNWDPEDEDEGFEMEPFAMHSK